jgi:hypothetical protein
MEKTAVEYLIEQLEFALPDIEWSNYRNETNKAKEIEKQQIIDAYSESAISFSDGILNKDDCKEEAENYYKDTFSN